MTPPSPTSITTALPNAVQRTLATGGHLIRLWEHAFQVLINRAAKPGKLPQLAPWLQPLFNQERATHSDGDGVFVSSYRLSADQQLTLLKPFLSQEEAQNALSSDQAHQLNTAPLPQASLTAAYINTPLAAALLHLRPLREYWEQELRRNHYESLIRLVPQAWLLSPISLPPGGIIPGLEINAWTELFEDTPPRSTHSIVPSHLALSPIDHPLAAQHPCTPEHVAAALSSFPAQPWVLSQISENDPSDALLHAIYRSDATGTHLLATAREKRSIPDINRD